MNHSSELQQVMDRCFWADEVTRATNAKGKLTRLQQAKELLLSGGSVLGLTGLIALIS